MYKSFALFILCIVIVIVAISKNDDFSHYKMRTETSGTMSAVSKLDNSGSSTYKNVANTNSNTNVKKYFGGKTEVLTPQALSYALDRLGMKSYSTSGKKIVVYPSPANCPYGKAFVNAVEQSKNNPANNQYYVYKKLSSPMNISATITNEREQKEYEERVVFLNACNMFCILNPKTGEVYGTDSVGESNARMLQSLLDEMK